LTEKSWKFPDEELVVASKTKGFNNLLQAVETNKNLKDSANNWFRKSAFSDKCLHVRLLHLLQCEATNGIELLHVCSSLT
jgi:hypothetical protein